jgi:hypothetical protein
MINTNPNHRPVPVRNWILRLALGAGVLAAVHPTANAGVIFSNFGPSFSYDTSAGNPVGNAFDGATYAEGSSFVAGASATFDSLRIALSCLANCPALAPFTISLASDAGDQPGAAIESFIAAGSSLGPLGMNNPPLLFSSVLHSTLNAGARYWVTVSAPFADSLAWNLNHTGDVSDEAISLDGGVSWFSPSGLTPGAFEVSSAVPEPADTILVVSGVLFLALKRKLRVVESASR